MMRLSLAKEGHCNFPLQGECECFSLILVKAQDKPLYLAISFGLHIVLLNSGIIHVNSHGLHWEFILWYNWERYRGVLQRAFFIQVNKNPIFFHK